MKYILVILGIISAVSAQIFVKNATLNEYFGKRWIVFMLLSVTFYGIAFLVQSYILKYFSLSKITPIMAIAIMILVIGCGVVIFKEVLTSKQIFGMFLGVISIYLILA